MLTFGRPSRAAAVVGGVAALLTALAGPVGAQPATPSASANLDVLEIPIGVDESTAGKVVALDVFENSPPPVRPDVISIEVDGSTAAGVLVVSVSGPDCLATGQVTTCEVPYRPAPFNVMFDALAVNLKVAGGAAVGDVGTVTVTVTGDGLAPTTTEHEITVAPSGSDLVGERVVGPEVAAGGIASYRPIIQNAGDQTAEVVRITLHDSRYARFDDRFRNCEAGDDGTLCTIEIELAPGETAQVSPESAIAFQVPAHAPHRHWASVFFEASEVSTAPATDPADGPLLEFVEISSGDFGPGRTGGQFAFQVGDNPADVAAIGAEITGAVGEVVDVTLAAVNDGPADVERTDGNRPNLAITFPAGVEVVSLGQDEGALDDGPRLCGPLIDGVPAFGSEPAGLDYVCDIGLLPAGERASFTFQVEITGTAATTGSVEVVGDFLDSDRDNQTADIVLNATGGTGGGLPVTGPPVLITAGAGTALLALGLAIFLAARQRRVRMVVPTE